MGTLPSSRLARILQEKAESLKKRRLEAEAATQKVEERVRHLEELGVVFPEAADRRAKIRDSRQKSDWDAVEAQSVDFLKYVEKSAGPELEKRRVALLETYDALRSAGATIAPEGQSLAEELRTPAVASNFAEASPRVVALARLVAASETSLAADLKEKALRLAKWAGAPDDRLADLETRLTASTAPIAEGAIAPGLERVRRDVEECVPAARERRERVLSTARAITKLARELGVSAAALDAATSADAAAFPTQWPETVPALEAACLSLSDALRATLGQTIEGLRMTVQALAEQGADPSENVAELGELLGRVPSATPAELPGLLDGARAAADGPVVGVVVSIVDEVRTRLVEARQLGRDPSEVFASMNRAREALRLKIYSEALAASRDALDRVSQLTEDLDEAREELASLQFVVGRLGEFGLPAGEVGGALERAGQELGRFEVSKAHATLRETARTLGATATEFFSKRLAQLRTVSDLAEQRGFLPPAVPALLAEARQKVDAAALAEAGDLLARIDVELRTAAGPYVARRVEEIEAGFEEITDPQLTASTRRFLADTDVSLRVKEDIGQSLEALKRAEHEATLVFASHASDLVERLETEHRVLEEMGGTAPDLQRQIDEVQQIFNMGEFLKAARATQEILARVREQETSRSEEAISHAKLAIVELGKMGVDTVALRRRFDEAQEASHGGHHVEAYRAAKALEAEAAQAHEAAQGVVDRIADVQARAESLRGKGVAVDTPLQELGEAREAYVAHQFEGATAQVDGVARVLEGAADAAEARRLLGEATAMVDDARKLSVATDEVDAKVAEAQAALDDGRSHDAAALARDAHERGLSLLKPVAAENMRLLEQDVEIAREAGLDLATVADPLAEARRRLVAAVPTGIAERIEAARAQLIETRGFLEQAQLAARRVREAYGQAEILHLTSPAVRERIEALERSLANRQYSRVIEAAGPLERELMRTTSQYVGRTVAGLQGTLSHARQEGSKTAVAEDLLGLARQALQQGHPLEALRLAGKSEAEVERFRLQTRLARGAVETLDAKIARLESEGIRVPGAAELSRRARAAIEEHELPTALELAIEGHDSLAETRETYRRAREALDAADRQVKEAMEFGADVAEVVALLEEARSRGHVGEYAEASARAREAADLSRWAIGRLYAGSLAQVRDLAETMRALGLEASGPVAASLEEAEVALQGKEWKRASDLLDRASSFAVATLDRLVERRAAALEARLGDIESAPPEAAEARRSWRARLVEARDQRDYPKAVELLKEEEGRAVGLDRSALERRLETLKGCLWVGEKLGLDTTPAMERFGEARLALSQGNLAAVPALVDAGTRGLEGQIEERVPTRAKELETELIFARDGLHVTLGNLEERFAASGRFLQAHQPIEAARELLAVGEELDRRKVRHRELSNLHYLIGAALQRATDRQLDTAAARALLDESTRAQETDYDVAVAKAREALKMLEGVIQAVEPPAGAWPFHRLPSS
jgi:hypothetical protein